MSKSLQTLLESISSLARSLNSEICPKKAVGAAGIILAFLPRFL